MRSAARAAGRSPPGTVTASARLRTTRPGVSRKAIGPPCARTHVVGGGHDTSPPRTAAPRPWPNRRAGGRTGLRRRPRPTACGTCGVHVASATRDGDGLARSRTTGHPGAARCAADPAPASAGRPSAGRGPTRTVRTARARTPVPAKADGGAPARHASRARSGRRRADRRRRGHLHGRPREQLAGALAGAGEAPPGAPGGALVRGARALNRASRLRGVPVGPAGPCRGTPAVLRSPPPHTRLRCRAVGRRP